MGDGRTESLTHGYVDGWTDGRMDGWTDKQMGCTDSSITLLTLVPPVPSGAAALKSSFDFRPRILFSIFREKTDFFRRKKNEMKMVFFAKVKIRRNGRDREK